MNFNDSNTKNQKQVWATPQLVEGCIKENTLNATMGGAPDGASPGS